MLFLLSNANNHLLDVVVTWSLTYLKLRLPRTDFDYHSCFDLGPPSPL